MMVDSNIQVTMARIEEKIDSVIARLNDGEDDHKDHEARIRALERKLWGYSGALGFIATASTSSLIYLLSTK
jgi:hypothetical protein